MKGVTAWLHEPRADECVRGYTFLVRLWLDTGHR